MLNAYSLSELNVDDGKKFAPILSEKKQNSLSDFPTWGIQPASVAQDQLAPPEPKHTNKSLTG